MKQICSPVTTALPWHDVKRVSIFTNLLDLYQSNSDIVLEYPLQMNYVNEQAVDLGGVSRDVMTAFWLHAYEKLFEGSLFFVPAVHPSTDFAKFEVLGKILSHGYLCTGFLPIRIALPTLIAMVLGPSVPITSQLFNQAFYEYLNEVDRSILNRAVQITQSDSGVKAFPSSLMNELITVFSNLGFREVPSPSCLLKTVSNIAKFVFFTNPMSAIQAVNAGIPSSHRAFWKDKSPVDLEQIYVALTATPSKVVSLIEEPYFTNSAEQIVYGYLRQFVGKMSSDDVRMFLRFVTGSSVCGTENITVQFNALTGLARRPIAHTCSSLLELPCTYTSYLEFEREFKLVLSADRTSYTWIMDSL